MNVLNIGRVFSSERKQELKFKKGFKVRHKKILMSYFNILASSAADDNNDNNGDDDDNDVDVADSFSSGR